MLYITPTVCTLSLCSGLNFHFLILTARESPPYQGLYHALYHISCLISHVSTCIVWSTQLICLFRLRLLMTLMITWLSYVNCDAMIIMMFCPVDELWVRLHGLVICSDVPGEVNCDIDYIKFVMLANCKRLYKDV